MAQVHTGKWPKTLPQLSDEQRRIRDDFMHHWHEVLPQRYGVIERFNHGWPAARARAGERTLEIGAGLGEHIEYESVVTPERYHVVELRSEMADALAQRHPEVTVVTGDCQRRLPYDDATFDRVLAIHVLEHLPDLPAALAEARRLLRPDGRLVAVIPCESGLAYSLARRISAQRVFERRYKMSYRWFIESEHVNVPSEIIEELQRLFRVSRRRFFPLALPSVQINLAIGLETRPLPAPA